MSQAGPATTWEQRAFSGAIPPIILEIPGLPVARFVSTLASFENNPQDGAGVSVPTADGASVGHHPISSSGQPLRTVAREIEFEVQMVGELDATNLDLLEGLAVIGEAGAWFHDPWTESWKGDGTRTTFQLARPAAWGLTGLVGVDFSATPARCEVSGVELVFNAGPPGPGEWTISTTTNAESFDVGTAPAAGALVTLRYYPIWRQLSEVEVGRSFAATNDGTVPVSLVSGVPVKNYG